MWYDMKILLGLRFSCSILNLFAANTIIHVLTKSCFAWSHYSTGTILRIFDKGSALRGHVAESFSVLSLLECQLNCVRLLPKCKSFNYKEKRNNSNVCEINTSSKDFAHVQDFIKDGESIYGEVINTTEKSDFFDIHAACKSQNAASNITIRYKANTVTYSQATSTCQDEGKKLCSENQVCCDGENPFNGVLVDDHWAPISDSINEWIQIGALHGHIAEKFSVLSLLECQLNCVRLLPKCKSFNYKEKRNNSNVCEINTSSKDFAHVQDFIKDGESIYGEVINTTEKADVPVIQDVCERRNAASDITVSFVANTITYLQATSTCHTNGKELCNAKQICCNETNPFNGVQSGDQWVPVSDSDNEWLQIGKWPHKPCLLHSKLGSKPGWGTKTQARGFKKYLFCCNPYMI